MTDYMSPLTRIILSLALRILHLVIFLFMMSGWLLSSSLWSLTYVLLIPAIVLHWWTNDGVCILTQWDNKLRGTLIEKDAAQGQFVKSVIKSVFGALPPDGFLKFSIYALLLLGWCVAAVRLYISAPVIIRP